MDKRRSVDVFGVRIRVKEVESASRTVELVATESLAPRNTQTPKPTLESAYFLTDQGLTDTLAYLL